MPPRGRKKVGLKRVDAAIDALKPMGYSADFVRRKVKELLDVYGDEGWTFIEEAAYSLLIEYILEDDGRQQCEEGEPSHKNKDRDQGNMEIEPTGAGTSQEGSEPLCNTQDTLPLSPVTVLYPLLPAAETDICPNTISAAPEALPEFGSDPPVFKDLYLAQVYPTSKRKPCLGWIGQKDENDFVLLQSAPVQGWRVGERRRKRKSRWDVSPSSIA